MLTSLKIANFRCFQHLEVPLKPLTVLIGPNNTGKSAFLAAIQLLCSPTTELESIARIDRFGLQPQLRPEITGVVTVAPNKSSLELVLRPKKQGEKNIQDNRKWLRTGSADLVSPISLFGATTLLPAMECNAATEKDGVPSLNEKADNVPAVLDALLRIDRNRFDQILAALRDLIPGFKDIRLPSPTNQTRRVDLVLENGLEIQGVNASSGVRLLIFFVVLANHPTPPKTILLEEPENGVHPKRLEDIVKLLRGLTAGRHAQHPTQVIITTHSPYLLDYIDITTDQVLVSQRRPDGERTILPVDANRLEGFLDEFMLGEVWINQEEEGLIRKEVTKDT